MKKILILISVLISLFAKSQDGNVALMALKTNNTDTSKFLHSTDLASYQTTASAFAPVVQYATPATGNTVAVNNGRCVRVLINPSGTLAALTITFPTSSLVNGDEIIITSSQQVITLTVSGGTIIGGLSSFAVGGFASYVYGSTANKWFRTN